MLTNEFSACIITNAHCDERSEKYSRGRRGAPAKGVGRATGARVQIPLSPLDIRKIKTFKKVLDKY